MSYTTEINSIANGQNSFNCQEESCNNPFADNYFNLQSIYSLCQEEAENMSGRDEYGRFLKGFKHTQENIERISSTLKGKKKSEEHKRNISIGKKGKQPSIETKRKISEANKGQTPWNKNEIPAIPTLCACGCNEIVRNGHKYIRGHTNWNKGRPTPIEGRNTISNAMKGKGFGFKKGHASWTKGLYGERSPGWKGGLSFEPYCHKFNEILKERIRERDNRTCQLCGAKENGKKLPVHHIHYDKKNCAPDLITLCFKCNSKANFNRDYWELFFMQKLNERGLIL